LFTFANRYTAFVDACVLANVLRRNVLLTLAEAEFFRLRWSRPVMDETRRAIRDILNKLPDADERAERACAMMEAAFEDAMVDGFEDLLTACRVLPDLKDTHVLAAALKTRADVLVTDNLKHFPSEKLASFNIEVRSADEFFADTIELSVGTAVGALKMMRSGFQRPALTVDDLFVRMEAQGLVATVDILRAHARSL